MDKKGSEVAAARALAAGPRKPLWKRLLLLLLQLVVSVGLLYLLLRKIPFRAAPGEPLEKSLVGMLRNVSLPLFFFVGIFHLIGYAITTFRWKVLLAGSGYRVKYFPLLISWICAGFFNAIMPSIIGGDVLLMYYSARHIGDGYRTAPIVFISRVTGITALVLIASVAILFKVLVLLTPATTVAAYWLVPALFTAGVVVLVIAVHPRVAAVIESLFDRLPVIRKFSGKLKMIFATFRVYRERRGHLFAALGLSILFHLNVVTYYYMCTVALGLDVAAIDAYIMSPIVIMLLMMPISIGGIGVRGVSFQKLLRLGEGQGILMEMIDVFWRLFFGLLGGAFLLVRRVRPSKTGDWLIAHEEVAAPDLSAFATPLSQTRETSADEAGGKEE